jgi:hypothetical protein
MSDYKPENDAAAAENVKSIFVFGLVGPLV